MLKKLIGLTLSKFLTANRGYIAHQSLPSGEKIDFSSSITYGEWVSIVAPDDGFFTIVGTRVIVCELQSTSINTLSGEQSWGKTFIPCRKGEKIRFLLLPDSSGIDGECSLVFVKLVGAQSDL